MQKIPLNLAKAGYVLAKPVARADGMVVAPQGAELTETMLDKFDMMGVEHVVVEGEPVQTEGVASGTNYDQRLQRLDHLFRHHAEDAWMKQVKALLTNYFKMKVASKAG
ncbi:MAG: hypothetical protein ACOZEN_09195 [Thermodesulfobacteriota bacterium]